MLPFPALEVYTWTGHGSLDGAARLTGPVPWLIAVQERCAKLRFTGGMELVSADGTAVAWQPWFAGRARITDASAIIIAGQMWLMGPGRGHCIGCRATQAIPDLDDRLTGGISLIGELDSGSVRRINLLCCKYLLCADVELRQRSGEVAALGFTYGRCEQAALGGVSQTPEQALSMLMKWDGGQYRVYLRPLLGADGLAEKPRPSGAWVGTWDSPVPQAKAKNEESIFTGACPQGALSADLQAIEQWRTEYVEKLDRAASGTSRMSEPPAGKRK